MTAAEIQDLVTDNRNQRSNQTNFEPDELLLQFSNVIKGAEKNESQNSDVLDFNESDPLTPSQRRDVAMAAEREERNPILELPQRIIDGINYGVTQGINDYLKWCKGQQARIDAEFTERFGKEIADQLKEIGCVKVEMHGDTMHMQFNENRTIAVNQNGLNSVLIERDVKFDLKRTNEGLKIENIKGIRLDHRKVYGTLSVPDITLKPNGEAKTWIASFPLPGGTYEKLESVMKKLGR